MREILFEIKRVGNSVKVVAMDSETLTEVSVVAPVGATETQMKNAALRKLRYVLSKNDRGDG